MPRELWQITSETFCAGLVVDNGRVVVTAPILKWMRGKPWAAMLIYMRRKGWAFHSVVHEE